MLLRVEALGLIALSVTLAGPVSSALARAAWPARSPRAALLLWQAIGLGGGLGILTAGLTLAAADTGRSWPEGVRSVPSHWSSLGVGGWAGVILTVCFGTWLVTASAAAGARVLIARRAHRRRLDLIAEARRAAVHHARGGTVTVRLVDYPTPLAYCLPGIRPQVVVSKGAFEALSPGELNAVLAHERAHARGHHDLVVQPFVAWARTFPFLPVARRTVAAVRTLVEMLADDGALRGGCEPRDLRRALQRIALDQSAQLGGTDDPARGLSARIRRLGRPAELHVCTTALVYAAAATLAVAPPLILLLS